MKTYKDQDTIDYYDYFSDIYELIWNEQIHTGLFQKPNDNLETAVENINKHLAKLAKVNGSSFVLNVGCGQGGSDRFLAGKIGARVVGIDTSEKQLEKAEKRKSDLDIQYKVGSMDNIPYPDNVFDFIWVQESFFHCHNKEKAVGKFFRVLKSGGKVIVEDTVLLNPSFKKEVLDYFGERIKTNTLFTVEDYNKTFKEEGFELFYSEDCTEHLERTYTKILEKIEYEREMIKEKIPSKYKGALEENFGFETSLKLTKDRKLGCYIFIFRKPSPKDTYNI